MTRVVVACLLTIMLINLVLVQRALVVNQHEEDTRPFVIEAKSKHYAFLLAGCNPDKPTYRGFLTNILISLRILRDRGSDVDFVVHN